MSDMLTRWLGNPLNPEEETSSQEPPPAGTTEESTSRSTRGQGQSRPQGIAISLPLDIARLLAERQGSAPPARAPETTDTPPNEPGEETSGGGPAEQSGETTETSSGETAESNTAVGSGQSEVDTGMSSQTAADAPEVTTSSDVSDPTEKPATSEGGESHPDTCLQKSVPESEIADIVQGIQVPDSTLSSGKTEKTDVKSVDQTEVPDTDSKTGTGMEHTTVIAPPGVGETSSETSLGAATSSATSSSTVEEAPGTKEEATELSDIASDVLSMCEQGMGDDNQEPMFSLQYRSQGTSASTIRMDYSAMGTTRGQLESMQNQDQPSSSANLNEDSSRQTESSNQNNESSKDSSHDAASVIATDQDPSIHKPDDVKPSTCTGLESVTESQCSQTSVSETKIHESHSDTDIHRSSDSEMDMSVDSDRESKKHSPMKLQENLSDIELPSVERSSTSVPEASETDSTSAAGGKLEADDTDTCASGLREAGRQMSEPPQGRK